MMQRFVLLALILLLGAFISCSGGGGSDIPCAAPTLITEGAWCITITSTTDSCGGGVGAPYTATFSQNGTSVSAIANGVNFSGSMCGNTATMTGNASGATSSTNVTFSDANHASGSTTWNSTSPACHGTDIFSAATGT